MTKLGIIGAMAVEVEQLKMEMQPPAGKNEIICTSKGGLDFYEGSLNGCPVVIVKSGIGKVNAALCAQRLIIEFGVTHIINSGIAGCVAHGLKPFDFVISTDAVYHDMNATGFGYKITQIPQMELSVFKADIKMMNLAVQAFNDLRYVKDHKIICGRVASGDQFISDSKIKDYIKEICNPACVEMEGAAIAHACYLNNIPFVIIRCISDMADDSCEECYSFNEKTAADLSASLVLALVSKM